MKPHLASVYFLIKWKIALALCIYPDKDSLSSWAGGLLAFFSIKKFGSNFIYSYVVQFNHLKHVLLTVGLNQMGPVSLSHLNT